MIQELHDVQQKAGATFELVGDVTIPVSFGNDATAIQAARQGVALVDLSHWGLLKISGDDRLRYLHNQSTNDFQKLKPGQGCDTVFVTSTARTIDLATAYVTEDAVLLLVSPNRRRQLIEWKKTQEADTSKGSPSTSGSINIFLITPSVTNIE